MQLSLAVRKHDDALFISLPSKLILSHTSHMNGELWQAQGVRPSNSLLQWLQAPRTVSRGSATAALKCTSLSEHGMLLYVPTLFSWISCIIVCPQVRTAALAVVQLQKQYNCCTTAARMVPQHKRSVWCRHMPECLTNVCEMIQHHAVICFAVAACLECSGCS